MARYGSPLVILILFSTSAISSPLSLQLFSTFKQPAVFRYSLCLCSGLFNASFPPILPTFEDTQFLLLPCPHIESIFLCSPTLRLHLSSIPVCTAGFFSPLFLVRETCFQYFSVEKCVCKREREGKKEGGERLKDTE